MQTYHNKIGIRSLNFSGVDSLSDAKYRMGRGFPTPQERVFIGVVESHPFSSCEEFEDHHFILGKVGEQFHNIFNHFGRFYLHAAAQTKGVYESITDAF
jgi:hypothetical protein